MLALVAAVVVVALIAWRLAHRHDAGATAEAPPPRPAPAIGIEPAHRADPRTLPRASITGTVTDERGAPIARAQVCAEASSAELPSDAIRDPWCSATDDHGAYRIGDLVAARYEVAAGAPTYRPAVLQAGFALQPGEQRDRRRSRVAARAVPRSGTVADVGGGPIARACGRRRADRGARRQRGISVETERRRGRLRAVD